MWCCCANDATQKKFGINWWISQDDSETGIWTKEKIKKISECWMGHYIKGDVLCSTAISQSNVLLLSYDAKYISLILKIYI